jgi:hypothetical protein
MMSYTLAQLRQELAKSLDSYVSGTATSGTTTTIVDTDLLDSGQYADDHFNGADIYIVDTTDDGAPEGEARYCTDFVQSTGTLTVGKAFSAAPGTDDTYEVYLNCTVEELNQALMFAVKDWRLYTSLTLSDNQAEYTVSADHLHSADQVIGVYLRETSDAEASYYPLTDYRVWDNAGTISLEFGAVDDIDSEMTCRIEYQAEYSQLKSSGSFSDAATVGGDLHLHVMNARKHYYERKMVSSSGVDRDWYASMVRYTNEQIDEYGGSQRMPSRKAKLQDFEKHPSRRFQPDWWI